jgi:uncharacterized protein (DUF924 family)
MPAHPADVVGFWRQAGPARWFAHDAKFDSAIELRFEQVHYRAARRDHDEWMTTAEGALALIILLDQFPRNLYRRTAHAFATDPLALAFARQAVAAGFDMQIEPALRAFFYMPFMHSEAPGDQQASVAMFTALMADDPAETQGYEYALLHRDLIQRFGRFPHRNPSLGRQTTDAEQAFLDEGGFAG